jgi:hypothetical protein
MASYKRPDFYKYNLQDKDLSTFNYLSKVNRYDDMVFTPAIQWTPWLSNNSILAIRKEEYKDYQDASQILNIPIIQLSMTQEQGWADTLDRIIDLYYQSQDKIALIMDDIFIFNNSNKSFINDLERAIQKGFNQCNYDNPIWFINVNPLMDNFMIIDCQWIRDNPWFRFRNGSQEKGPVFVGDLFISLLYIKHTKKFPKAIAPYLLGHKLCKPGGLTDLRANYPNERQKSIQTIMSYFPDWCSLIKNDDSPGRLPIFKDHIICNQQKIEEWVGHGFWEEI